MLAASNPEVLASKTVGPTSRAWPVAQQRDAVLDRVRARYRPGGAGKPDEDFGAFPDAWSIPDPPFGVWP